MATAENTVGEETDNMQYMRHPSSAVQCRDMDVTIQRMEEIGCLPSSMPTTHPPDKVHVPNQEVISRPGLSCIGDIISCRRLSLFGLEAWLDSDVPVKDALKSACARHTELHPRLGWRRPPGRPRQTWLHQIGDGSAVSIRQEWDLAVGRGHSRRMRSALQISAAYAF